jgi:hypothetical protein
VCRDDVRSTIELPVTSELESTCGPHAGNRSVLSKRLCHRKVATKGRWQRQQRKEHYREHRSSVCVMCVCVCWGRGGGGAPGVFPRPAVLLCWLPDDGCTHPALTRPMEMKLMVVGGYSPLLHLPPLFHRRQTDRAAGADQPCASQRAHTPNTATTYRPEQHTGGGC